MTWNNVWPSTKLYRSNYSSINWILEYSWLFPVSVFFSVRQLRITVLHARWRTATFCAPYSYFNRQQFYWLVDWSWRIKGTTPPLKFRSYCMCFILWGWSKNRKNPDLNKARFIYLLTPWSWLILEKLAGSQLVKKFPAFYGTRKFITVFNICGSVHHAL